MKQKLVLYVLCPLLGVSLISLMLSDLFFVFDLFSHFQLQYVVLILCISGIALCTKKYTASVIGFMYSAVVISMVLFPLKVGSSMHEDPDIFFMNTLFSNTSTESIYDYIQRIDASTVAFVEINKELQRSLESLYGEAIVYHDEEALSCAIFSKEKALKGFIDSKGGYPVCIAEFETYTLFVAHPYPPFSPSLYEKQKKYFEYIHTLLLKSVQEGKDFVLVGDLNSTPFSALFRKFFSEYSTHKLYSWNNPHILMIPIDHAFSNRFIRVSLSPRLSSDHRGLMVDIK